MQYQLEAALSVEEFTDILNRSTLAARRPVMELDRIQTMLRKADVLVTARDETKLLVGVARAITDYSYCTYLSDLAVDKQFQGLGIGKRLIDWVHRTAGLETRLILLAAPAAATFYPHIGMERHESCWTLPPRS